MRQIDFPIATLEFADRTGVIRQAYECSILGRDEFFQRLDKLTQIIENAHQSETIANLYRQDRWFRHNCDRCLLLCNVDPDWLNESMLSGLLFGQKGAIGALVELNIPKQSDTQSKGKPATDEDMIALLWELTGGLGEASAIANDIPASVVGDVLKSRSHLHQSPEDQKKEEVERWKQQVNFVAPVDLSQLLSPEEIAFRGG
jgi:hypothetical protein